MSGKANEPISFSKALERIEDGLLGSPSYQLAEEVLKKAEAFPQAFKLLPKGNEPGKEKPWASYPFDEKMNLWINSSHPEALEFYGNVLYQEKEIIMSTALTAQEKGNVYAMLEANISTIKSILPKHLPPEKALRLAYQCVTSAPKLARCTQLSLLNAIVEASGLGLEIGGPLGYTSMIPFKNQAKLIVEYKGKIALALRSGIIKSFPIHPVFSRDEFDYEYGTHKYLKHKPYRVDPTIESDTRGHLIAAYAIVEYSSGGYDFEVVEYEEAMAAKEHSMAKNKSDSPWNTADEWKMWAKTAVHTIFKRIPKNPEMQRVVDSESKIGTNEDQFDHIIDVEFNDMNDKPKTDEAPETTSEDQESVVDAPGQEAEPEPEVDDLDAVEEYSDADKKIVESYKKAKEFFKDDEYPAACKDLKLDPNGKHTVEQMELINKAINNMV